MNLESLLGSLFGFPETLHESIRLVQEVRNLEGDIVECGIAAGSQFAAMKLAVPEKRAWGYDSFEGIQLAGKEDEYQPGFGPKLDPNRELPTNLLVSSGITVCSYENVIINLSKWRVDLSTTRLIRGWVQHTMAHPENLPEKICILRLDMDMHDPTLFALEKLFPRLVPGGVLLIDDWGYAGVRLALSNYFASIDYVPKWHTPLHTGYLYK